MTTLPAVALRGTAVLPGMIVHFDISRPRSAASVNRAMLKDQKIFLILQRDVHVEDPAIDDVWNVGVYASIKQVVKLPKNMILPRSASGNCTSVAFNGFPNHFRKQCKNCST